MWWQYHPQWGPLKPFEGVVHGAHGKPLQIAGKTKHLNLQWGKARGRTSFILIISLESPPVLTGMDIMSLLHVRIDVTNGTATPAQLDPQTIHLNGAQAQDLPSTSRALLLQAGRQHPCRDRAPVAQRGCLLLPRRRPAHICVRSARTYQWIRSMGRVPQPPSQATPPSHRTSCGYLGSCRHHRRSASINRLPTLPPAAHPYAPVAHSTTTAEGPLPGIQRHCEPKRR